VTVLGVLDALSVLLANPAAWRKGGYAGHRLGEPDTSPNGEWSVIAEADICSPAANCWCLLGAIDRVIGKQVSQLRHQVRAEIAKTLGLVHGFELSTWQDAPMRSHDDVLSAIEGTRSRLLELEPS
jgi:hypothetical protein